MTPLRQRMIDEMTLRGMSPRTHESYLGAVFGLTRYYKQSPDTLNADQIRGYLLHLERDRRLAWSSLNVAASGLRFFFQETLGWKDVHVNIPPRKTPQRLPEVLSPEEVDRLLAAVEYPKHRVILSTIYAAGLRVSEAVRLRVQDIDKERMSIRVEQGKGRKDRYTILSPRLLDELRRYWKQHPSKEYLFTGNDPARPLDVSAVQRAYNCARQRAGIKKGSGVHTLRHYAAFRTMPSNHLGNGVCSGFSLEDPA